MIDYGMTVTYGVTKFFAYTMLPCGSIVSRNGDYPTSSTVTAKPHRERERFAEDALWATDAPRDILRCAARQIAANNDTEPVSKLAALRKIFIQERRDRSRPGNPRVGWKRGEIFEVIHAALFDREHLAEEWGDIGYHTAQSYDALWKAYKFVTPCHILHDTCYKYVERARRGMRK